MLTMLVVSWWLCAIFGTFFSIFYVAFWRPEPIYNSYAYICLFVAVIVTMNCVHISQFFITLERIIIMKSASSICSHKLLLTLCILINVGSSIFLVVLVAVNFSQKDDNNFETRMPILRLIDIKTYLISYYISNGICLITLMASLYFLVLFRKTTKTKAGTPSSKMESTIKFTIWVDIWLDFLPQILTIGLTLLDSPFGPYVATVQRVLFTFCGIFVNRKFYKVFVVNENIVANFKGSIDRTVIPMSNLATRRQSKTSGNAIVPANHIIPA
uniref:7TM_GPCR_Srx domain-containing protein n=1 Tax=Panagrellus redivivus TaxID=6233 RepID=A0A7E4ULB8_PANRE